MATSERILLRRLKLRKLLRLKVSVETIIKELGISARTYFRDIECIKREDIKWINEMGHTEFLTSYRISLESIEEEQRGLRLIAMNAERDADKITARKAIIDAEVQIVELRAYGATVMSMTNANIPKHSEVKV